MPFTPEWFLSAELLFGLSPLLIVLFAFEMTALEVRLHDKRLSQKEENLRFAIYFFKLPGSLILPVVAGNVGGAVICVVNILSIIDLIREAKYEISTGRV